MRTWVAAVEDDGVVRAPQGQETNIVRGED